MQKSLQTSCIFCLFVFKEISKILEEMAQSGHQAQVHGFRLQQWTTGCHRVLKFCWTCRQSTEMFSSSMPGTRMTGEDFYGLR